MYNVLLVFIGGGLGSVSRYGLSVLLTNYQGRFPWATLLANAASSLLVGIFLGIFLLTSEQDRQLSLLFVMGYCGGFSTFSTFSYETYNLFNHGEYGLALLNIFSNLFVCMICIFAGLKSTTLL